MTMNKEKSLVFKRRLGSDPHANGKRTVGCDGCPDLWELEDGDFAIIGIDITAETKGKLPSTASCGPDERVIRLPRSVVLSAKADIAEIR